jgi:prefoldin subunit 5
MNELMKLRLRILKAKKRQYQAELKAIVRKLETIHLITKSEYQSAKTLLKFSKPRTLRKSKKV